VQRSGDIKTSAVRVDTQSKGLVQSD